MPKLEISLDRGSFFRVLIGLAMTLFFIVSAIISDGDRWNGLFLVGLAAILTWQQYSLYLIKKQEDNNT